MWRATRLGSTRWHLQSLISLIPFTPIHWRPMLTALLFWNCSGTDAHWLSRCQIQWTPPSLTLQLTTSSIPTPTILQSSSHLPFPMTQVYIPCSPNRTIISFLRAPFHTLQSHHSLDPPFISYCTWAAEKHSHTGWSHFKFMIIMLKWTLTTTLQTYYISPIHSLFHSPRHCHPFFLSSNHQHLFPFFTSG